jgi:DNA-binding response OmpR family regulator
MGVILVVDDDAGIRNNVERILTAEGHTVLTADNGQQGLLLVHREHPDLVLTDLSMPGLDGRAFCEAIRNDVRTRETRIIAMSAGPALYAQATGLKADSVVAKPFTSDVLIANVKLQLHRLHDTHHEPSALSASPGC